MIEKEKITEAIFEAIDDFNDQFTPKTLLEKSNTAVVFGQNGVLDSIGLVNFVVTVEDKIADSFGKTITLADEKAMSQKNSPFKTIESLSDYIFGLLKGDL